MAGEPKVLTPEQEAFLDLVGNEEQLKEIFYFTGGTPLAAFYLHHRLSEDIVCSRKNPFIHENSPDHT